MKMRMKSSVTWFLAFTGMFAVLAAVVFWGTWSLDVVPVMPDEANVHSMVWADVFRGYLERIISSGRILPDDPIWFGWLGSPYFWQEFRFALCAFFTALGVVYYCRGRGLSYPASYGAGLFLAFCGYWFSLFAAGHGGWFRLMLYCVFPFGLADRAVRKNKLKNWLLLGAMVAWGMFYQPDIWLFFTVFTAFYFVWCCWRERKLPSSKGVCMAAVSFLVIGTPGLRSACVDAFKGREKHIEDSKGTALTGGKGTKGVDDSESRWIFATNWSLPPAETAEFVISRINGDTSCPYSLSIGPQLKTGISLYTGALGRPIDAKQGNYRQHSLYVGWVTVLLAFAGVVFGRRQRDVCFFAAAAIVCWMLSMGRYCEPVYRLVFALPVGDSIRCPVKWHHLTELCLCVLAAYGIHCVWNYLSVKFVQQRRIVLAGLLVLILWGCLDLARINHVYCVPVDVSRVRQTNSSMQMTVLRRDDFKNPQVQAMVRAGRIVSLANYMGMPDMFLVEVLTPWSKPGPLPPISVPFLLGMLSLCGMLGVLVYAARVSVRRR